MAALVWLRADLRLDDNRALALACARHRTVHAVFLPSSAQWQRHHWGTRRQLFVWHHALVLRESLAERGIALWIVPAPLFSDAPAAVADLAAKLGARQVYANREFGVNEIARDRATAALLVGRGMGWNDLEDFNLLPCGSVSTRGR